MRSKPRELRSQPAHIHSGRLAYQGEIRGIFEEIIFGLSLGAQRPGYPFLYSCHNHSLPQSHLGLCLLLAHHHCSHRHVSPLGLGPSQRLGCRTSCSEGNDRSEPAYAWCFPAPCAFSVKTQCSGNTALSFLARFCRPRALAFSAISPSARKLFPSPAFFSLSAAS